MLWSSFNETSLKLFLKLKFFFLIFVRIYIHKFSDHQLCARAYVCKPGQNLHKLQKIIHTKVCPNKVINLQLTTYKWQYVTTLFCFLPILREALSDFTTQNLEVYLLRYSFFTYGEPHNKVHTDYIADNSKFKQQLLFLIAFSGLFHRVL